MNTERTVRRHEVKRGDRIRMQFNMYGIDTTKEFTVDGVAPGMFLTNNGEGCVYTNEPAATGMSFTVIETD